MRWGGRNWRSTAVAATASGGATIAPSAIAAAHGSAGTSVCATTATTVPAPGSGSNVADDPGFVGLAAPADLHLTPTSPLVDRGDPAAVTPGELDLDGQPRALDGNHVGGGVPVTASDYTPVEPLVTPSCPPRPSGDGTEGGDFVSWVYVTTNRKDAS